MLLAHSMGSHGGQQNFPFGYLPSEVHGIGLPDFMTPGPPSGQPLLSEHETQNFDTFLNGFDIGGDTNRDGPVQNIPSDMGQGRNWMMPPTLVGSETSLRAPTGAEWQNFPMAEFTFGNDMNLASMPPSSEYNHGGLPAQGFVVASGHYDHNHLSQLHDAAQTVQPSYGQSWQPSMHNQVQSRPQQPPRPAMRFGSDPHFQHTGYSAPEGQYDQTPNLDWLEGQSSVSNTQPNTEPNTQPSSPNWSKKRKIDDFHADGHRNGFMPTMNGYATHPQMSPSTSSSHHHKRPSTKPDHRSHVSQSPTPTRMNFPLMKDEAVVDEDATADYDDDDDDEESRTRSNSPASGSRSAKTEKGTPQSKPARARKKSTASNAPSRSKSKPSRASTSGGTPASRVPLTADQKKANHTNSEQRRRDATAKAYAELYDLVPELDEMGKQSTMKKLEVVVSKVEKVRDRVRQLRLMLGFDPDTSTTVQHHTSHSHMSTGSSRSMGDLMSPDMTNWPR